MVGKRYTPRYKVLSRFKQPIWLEKRVKLQKFEKRKWEFVQKMYFPKKLKFFTQDVSSCTMDENYDGDRVVRLKKTYRFSLQDKQRLQLYYGCRRLKFFQLSYLSKEAIRLSKIYNVSYGKMFLHLLESRFDVSLYRLGLASSLMQSRRLINSGSISILPWIGIKALKKRIQKGDFLHVDPAVLFVLLGRFLRLNSPFFYFQNRTSRKRLVTDRKNSFFQSRIQKDRVLLLKNLRIKLTLLKNNIK